MSEPTSSSATGGGDNVFSASTRAKHIQYCPHCTLPPDFCRYGPVYNECKSWLTEHYPQYLKPEDAPASASSAADGVSDGVAKLKVSDSDDAVAETKSKSSKKKGKKKQTLAEKQAAAGGGGDAWSDEDDKEVEQPAADDDDDEEGDDDDDASDDSDSSDKPKRRIKQTSALDAAAAKASGKTASGKAKPAEKILISKAQRSKNKYITTIRGLDSYGLTLKEVAKAMSKKFACSASVVKVVPSGQEIAVQGDVQQDAPDFLVEKFGGQIPEDQIYIVQEGTGKKVKAFD